MLNLKKIISLFVVSLIAVVGIAQSMPYITDSRLEIALPTVKGDTLKLSSLKGKVILLDFWASWCGPCRSSNRQLVKLYSRYKDKGFEILGVSLDENKKDWIKAISRDRIKWLQINDSGGWDAKTAIDWNISQIPTSFLVGRDGKIIAMDLEKAELEKALAGLLDH
jgi:thiol-disulfide isomerase/thioredoxin